MRVCEPIAITCARLPRCYSRDMSESKSVVSVSKGRAGKRIACHVVSEAALNVVQAIKSMFEDHEQVAEDRICVLTRRGWASVSCFPCLAFQNELNLFTRFEQSGLRSFYVSPKWNHFLDAATAVERAVYLFSSLRPSPEELPRIQFLAAVGRELARRKSWHWDRILGTLAGHVRPGHVRLRVLGQPGCYSANLGIWQQADVSTFAKQDENAFWEIVAEFGGYSASRTSK